VGASEGRGGGGGGKAEGGVERGIGKCMGTHNQGASKNETFP